MFTAIFLGCLAVSAIIVTLGVISDATGADMPGYVQPAPVSVAVPPAVVDPVVMSTEKKDLTPNGESIIGLRDPSLTVNSTAALVVTTEDYTTYGDRAIIKLTNATGASINLTGMCIRGKPVMQLAGQNGYVWEYSDYDAIEKEGEQFVEVSNDFIFDPVQAKQIGDFVWKELKPHKLYSLMLVGMHYNYEIGDVYHLTLTHVMNGGTMENIDTDVEVMGTSMSRDVGGVGATNLNLRVPSEAWALTLAKNSKLVGAGNAQRLNNRSNVVTVASSTWTGQADYFCDGTDDDVEIQAAIDYLDSIGGGQILLTSGTYIFSNTIFIKSDIILDGSGSSTTLTPSSTSVTCMVDFGAYANSFIRYLSIDGNGSSLTFTTTTMNVIDGSNSGVAYDVIIKNYSFNKITNANEFYLFRYMLGANRCSCINNNINVTSGEYAFMVCFANSSNISNCTCSSTASGDATRQVYSFYYCSYLSSCSSINNALTTSLYSELWSFYECDFISSCASINNTSYFISSFNNCTNISSCGSTGNTAIGGYSFNACQKITVSASNSNSNVLDGFQLCRSVQQCSSTDLVKYDRSYADSGTANACADTAAGGYNS